MKKKIIVFAVTLCVILSCAFMMSACNDNTTDVAYVQFVPAVEGEVVQYTSYMYADDGSKSHIYLFANEESRDAGTWADNCLLGISFKRGFGVDYDIDENETFVTEIEGWFYMKITIKKEYYDFSKKVYLNGEDITLKADPTLSTPPKEGSNALGTFWYDGVYYFEDFGLVKGNKSNYINKIEYK